MKDTSLEVTRWSQTLKSITIQFLVFWIFLALSEFFLWIADGYAIINDDINYDGLSAIIYPALGEMLPISILAGLFIGWMGTLIIQKTYTHPFNASQDKIHEERSKNNSLLADGEWAVRGAEIQIGPWPDIIDITKKKAAEAEKTLGLNHPLPPIRIADAPFPYSFENRGLYIQGSAGSGKSQVIKQMIYDIRNRGGRDKLIIYDRKPEYLPIFYRDGDIIICPADRRHTPWDLFSEVKSEIDFGGILASLIPETTSGESNQRFWDNSARDVMLSILLRLRNETPNPSNKELVEFLFMHSTELGELWKELSKDQAAAHYGKTLKAAAQERNMSTIPTSVMATLSSYISSFTRPEVAERGWFSVKDWIRSPETEGQALFLVNPAKYSSDYQSFFTVIIDLAMREMLSLPNDIDRRIWFFVDEFGSLFKLDSVVRLLAEGRSKGACTVLGTQDMAQIRQKYKDDTETLVNNCNSKVIARVTSKDEAKYISEMIGDLEVEKESEKTDYTFDKGRGFSMSLHDSSAGGDRRTKAAVMPAEISNLPDLTFLCKFGDKRWFRNLMEYYPWNKHEFFPDFLERPESFFDSNRLIQQAAKAAQSQKRKLSQPTRSRYQPQSTNPFASSRYETYSKLLGGSSESEDE
jgi:hypothetical protein